MTALPRGHPTLFVTAGSGFLFLPEGQVRVRVLGTGSDPEHDRSFRKMGASLESARRSGHRCDGDAWQPHRRALVPRATGSGPGAAGQRHHVPGVARGRLVTGNLTDPEACRRAVRGDRWSTMPRRRWATGADGTSSRPIASTQPQTSRAAAESRVGRFLHISSTSATDTPPIGREPIDETAPLGQNVWV